MGRCPICSEELIEVVESNTDAKFAGDATVRECPECGGSAAREDRRLTATPSGDSPHPVLRHPKRTQRVV